MAPPPSFRLAAVRPAPWYSSERSLDREGDARDQQHDTIRHATDLLIHLAQQIAKESTTLERRNDTAADLVGHDEHRGRRRTNRRHHRLEVPAPAGFGPVPGQHPAAVRGE